MDLSDAFDRIEAFCVVQKAQQSEFTPEAVARLLEAADLYDEELGTISERLPALGQAVCGGDVPGGAVLLGMLIGLFAV
jgi:hypothetical protein